jgi:hypothetical protein
MFDYPYIRDELIVDHTVQTFYDEFAGDGPVFLLGRVVKLQQTLRVGQRPLVIVADEFDGNGQTIDARGGYPGQNGGTVIVRCKRSVNTAIDVSGGLGATGANGADGTDGTPDIVIEGHWETVADPWPMETTHEVWVPGEVIPGTPGTPPGSGWPGGPGGNAGTLVFSSITQEGWLTLLADGGPGGTGGAGGFLHDEQALQGEDGEWGAAAPISNSVVSEDEHLALVRADIGIYANYWAPFRIVVGDYYYHRYNSMIPDRAQDLLLAAREFEAALQFQPDNIEALRLQRQLVGYAESVPGTNEFVWKGGGNNALGLPPELDLLPRFDYYIDTYLGLSSLVIGFLGIGTQWLLGVEGFEAMSGFAAQELASVTAARENAKGELEIARSEQSIAGKERDYAQQRLDKIIVEIQAAIPVMETKSFSIGGLIGTVASIGAAVVAVVAAIPTAGASLIAVVPSMIALADSVSSNGEEIAKTLLKGNKSEDFEKVKAEYAKAGKDVSNIVKGAKSIVNFVNVIKNIDAGSTPDNSKYVALVKQGAELAYAVMLAENRVSLAGQRVEAAQARVERADALVVSVRQLVQDLATRTHSIRQVGLAAIEIATSKARALQTMAFYAQRSLEIYTLQSHEQNVLLDAGMIHPDISRAYYEGEVEEAQLAAVLLASWGNILSPIGMKLAYNAFFLARPDWDTHRLSFGLGTAEMQSFLNTKSFWFKLDATDLPDSHFETKIKNVLVSFVGAATPSGEVSCIVRHGGQYEQRRKDRTIDVQQLEPRLANRRAKTIPLDRPVANLDPPLDAPTSLALWGRGVGGDWEVTLESHEIDNLDLSRLTEIQVWIDYQFIR